MVLFDVALSRSVVPMPDTVEAPDFEPDEVPGCAALAVVFSVAFVSAFSVTFSVVFHMNTTGKSFGVADCKTVETAKLSTNYLDSILS